MTLSRSLSNVVDRRIRSLGAVLILFALTTTLVVMSTIVLSPAADARCDGYGINGITSLYFQGTLRGRERALTPSQMPPSGTCDENAIYNWSDIDDRVDGQCIRVDFRSRASTTWTTMSSNCNNSIWSSTRAVNLNNLSGGYGPGVDVRVCLGTTSSCAVASVSAA